MADRDDIIPTIATEVSDLRAEIRDVLWRWYESHDEDDLLELRALMIRLEELKGDPRGE